MATIINLHPRVIIEAYAGPASYQPGGFVVTTVAGPIVVEQANVIESTKGYHASVTGISGQNLLIQAYASGATEVTSGTVLTTVTFTVMEIGL